VDRHRIAHAARSGRERETIMRHIILGSTAVAAASLLAPAAMAQQADGAANGLDDIIVTAERRESRLQDTPISITALSADQLTAQGIRSVNDLGGSIPNLTSTTGPQGSGDANFFIRGVGQFDFIVTNDPGVGLYVDGVYLGRTVGAMLDAGDIARVEVLRGPQGTLFGRNTLGGAISVVTNQPDPAAFSAGANGVLGSRNRIDADGFVNAPLGDAVAVRVAAYSRNQDGFARNEERDILFGKTKRWGVRGSAMAEFGALTATLALDYGLDRSNPAPSVLRAIVPAPFFPPDAATQIQRPNDFYRVFASNAPEARNETWGASLTLALDIGEATVKSITAYRDLTGFSTSDPDGTGYRLYDQETDTDQTQFSQEIQLSGTSGRFTYLVGGYFFKEQAEQELRLCFAPITNTPTEPGNPCNSWNQGNDQETESWAVFGQARFALTEALSFTLGGRYTWETKSNVSNQAFDFRPAGAGPGAIFGFGLPLNFGDRVLFPIVQNLPGKLSFNKFTPRVGVEFKAAEDVLLFASYAKGFRSGGFNGRLIAPQASIPTYAPDTNDAFELGLKSDLLDRTLRFNATAFYSKYKGIQQTISDPAVQFRVANAGDAELYGFELELTAVPVADLRFDIGFGYSHSEFQNVPAAVGPINGNQLPFNPEWNVIVGGEYRIVLGGAGTLTPRVDYRLQSEVHFTAFNLPLETQRSYGLLSARLTWADASERFSVAVFGENLTDEHYYTFGQDALGAQGVAYTYLGRPREFGVRAGFRF
jgi:iron complex outermembrane receptor protein